MHKMYNIVYITPDAMHQYYNCCFENDNDNNANKYNKKNKIIYNIITKKNLQKIIIIIILFTILVFSVGIYISKG